MLKQEVIIFKILALCTVQPQKWAYDLKPFFIVFRSAGVAYRVFMRGCDFVPQL